MSRVLHLHEQVGQGAPSEIRGVAGTAAEATKLPEAGTRVPLTLHPKEDGFPSSVPLEIRGWIIELVKDLPKAVESVQGLTRLLYYEPIEDVEGLYKLAKSLNLQELFLDLNAVINVRYKIAEHDPSFFDRIRPAISADFKLAMSETFGQIKKHLDEEKALQQAQQRRQRRQNTRPGGTRLAA